MKQDIREFEDHLGNRIRINYPPKRIISLVPSISELLFDLGLDCELVGITKFCVHPNKQFLAKEKIGGTKSLRIDQIRALAPDLIIGNKEENNQEDIERLQQLLPVWMSDIYDLKDTLTTIADIGRLVNREAEAAYINHLIQHGFRDLALLASIQNKKPSVAYCIWKDPYMFVGPNTFVHHILETVGFKNVVITERYPVIELAELAVYQPDYVFLSSEPFPFKEQHKAIFKQHLPKTELVLVDGEMFSWYGSRLVKAVQYLFELQKNLVLGG